MAPIYGMWQGPQYQGMTAQEAWDSAFDLPMSLGATLLDQAKGGVLDSYGLGTAIGIATTPQPLTDRPARGESLERRAARREAYANSMTEDEFKASAYYRDGIKFDKGMTPERAQALAESFDRKKVREYFAQKRPIASFIGNLAGQALDPINYIPIAGPVVRAAAIAKAGRLAGTALVGAADAAANTAIFGAASAPVRSTFGDDVTWQEIVSDIGTAALIGGAFGGVSGAIGRAVDARRAARMEDARRAAQEQMATIRTIQDSRIALNDAIDAVANGGEVSLNPAAVDAVKRISERINPVWSPETFASMDRADLFSSSAIGRMVDARPPLVQSFEDIIRGEVFRQYPELQARYQATETNFLAAQDRVASLEEALQARRESDAVALIDPDSAARLKRIEADMEAKPNAKRLAALEAERQIIVETIGPDAISKAEKDYRIGPEKQIKAARKSLAAERQEFSKARNEVNAIGERLRSENAVRYRVAVDTSPASPEPPPAGRQEAETRAAKPDTMKDVAAQHAVSPDDGSFAEQADIDRLRSDGVLSEADEAELADADKTFENGVAYANALESVVGCFLR